MGTPGSEDWGPGCLSSLEAGEGRFGPGVSKPRGHVVCFLRFSTPDTDRPGYGSFKLTPLHIHLQLGAASRDLDSPHSSSGMMGGHTVEVE